MNQDQVIGRAEQVKGIVKEFFGKVSSSRKMTIEGEAQRTKGIAQAAFGDFKEDLKSSAKNASSKEPRVNIN